MIDIGLFSIIPTPGHGQQNKAMDLKMIKVKV